MYEGDVIDRGSTGSVDVDAHNFDIAIYPTFITTGAGTAITPFLLYDRRPGVTLDQFDFVAVRGIDKNEAVA